MYVCACFFYIDIIVGSTTSFGPNEISNIYVLRINSVGDTLWTKTYNFGEPSGGCSINQTYDGGYIITGFVS